MIGIGKWQGTVNIQILKFSGDVVVTISDNNGEYAVDIQLPKQLEMVKLRFDTIEEVGDNALKGKGKLLTPAGRELAFEAGVDFDGDEMGGYLKIAIANIKIKNGHKIGGFTAYTTSDILGGSGLSSSAAFEDMIGTILNYLYNDGTVDYIEISKISQYAENVHFGKPCGLMDQVACAAGGFVTIDFENPKAPIAERIAFDLSAKGYALCIVNTGGSHANLTDDYAAVPAEMKAVAAHFGKPVLRGLTEEQIISNAAELRKKCGDRAILRALHFIRENKRVERMLEALSDGNTKEFFNIIKESGNSSANLLQNYYTPKAPSEQGITLACAIASETLGNDGAYRVHGGGFAGTMQAFVPYERMEAFRQNMEAVFGKGAVTELSVRPLGACAVYHV